MYSSTSLESAGSRLHARTPARAALHARVLGLASNRCQFHSVVPYTVKKDARQIICSSWSVGLAAAL